MSAAKKAAWADPEVRARMSAAKKAALADKRKSLGLEDHELSEWRAIRAKGFTGPEAARIVIRSRKAAAA